MTLAGLGRVSRVPVPTDEASLEKPPPSLRSLAGLLLPGARSDSAPGGTGPLKLSVLSRPRGSKPQSRPF